MLATLGERVAAPHLRNKLSLQLHTIESVEILKKSIEIFVC